MNQIFYAAWKKKMLTFSKMTLIRTTTFWLISSSVSSINMLFWKRNLWEVTMLLFMNREFQKEICVRSRLRNKYWVEPATENKVAYKNWVEPSTENKVAYQKLGWTINGKQSSVPNTLLNHQRKTKQRTKNREISASKSEGKVLRNIWVKFQQKVSKLTKVFGILLNLSCQIREWLPNKGMIAK